jgi:Cu+-exporting ATPase
MDVQKDHKGQYYHHHGHDAQATLAAEKSPVTDQTEGVIYTCPMHPQVRQIGPGNCPICGMTLEPEVVTAETGPSAEYLDTRRRFWIGLVLSVPVLMLEMGGHLTNLHMVLGAQTSNWIQLVLATPVVLWAGFPFFKRAWKSLVTMRLNMFTLIAMGTGVSWIYSVVATLSPSLFPATLRSADGSVATYFEAAAVITVLVLLGQVLELQAVSRPVVPSVHFLTLLPRRRAGSAMVSMRTSTWRWLSSGIGFGFAPVKRSQSMAALSKVAVRLMNR